MSADDSITILLNIGNDTIDGIQHLYFLNDREFILQRYDCGVTKEVPVRRNYFKASVYLKGASQFLRIYETIHIELEKVMFPKTMSITSAVT